MAVAVLLLDDADISHVSALYLLDTGLVPDAERHTGVFVREQSAPRFSVGRAPQKWH